MITEQFDFLEIVIYTSGVCFAYDMRTKPGALLDPKTAAAYLTEFAATHTGEAADRAAVHAKAFT